MSQFQNSVKKELEENGWTVYDKGWPDFLCVKDGKIMAAEVKNNGDLLSIDQENILNTLLKFLPVKTIHPGPGYGDSENSEHFHILMYHGTDVRCKSVVKFGKEVPDGGG
jgi:hypothetical protein